jgi:hypothetical protein
MIIELKSIKINDNLIFEISQRFRDNLEISELCIFLQKKLSD